MTHIPFKATRFSRKRIVREAAIAAALAVEPDAIVYASAIPCLRGHVGARFIKGDTCKACSDLRNGRIAEAVKLLSTAT
jgi:hypothetical protein